MMNKHISHIGRPGGYGSDMDVFSEEDDEHSVAGQVQGQHYFEEDDNEHSAGQVQGQGHRWFH